MEQRSPGCSIVIMQRMVPLKWIVHTYSSDRHEIRGIAFFKSPRDQGPPR